MVTKSRMMWTVDLACTREVGNTYEVLVGKPEGKRPLGRPRHRYLRKVRCNDADRINLSRDRHKRWDLENNVMILRIYE